MQKFDDVILDLVARKTEEEWFEFKENHAPVLKLSRHHAANPAAILAVSAG